FRIGVWRDDEVIFQSLSVAMINEVDSGVQIAVADLTIVRNPGSRAYRIIREYIVCISALNILTGDTGTNSGLQQFHPHAGLFSSISKNDLCSIFGKEQEVIGAAREVFHFPRGLTVIFLKTEGKPRVRGDCQCVRLLLSNRLRCEASCSQAEEYSSHKQ